MENEECAVHHRMGFRASATTWRSIEKEFRGEDCNLRYQVAWNCAQKDKKASGPCFFVRAFSQPVILEGGVAGARALERCTHLCWTGAVHTITFSDDLSFSAKSHTSKLSFQACST